jgi:hypothetical protein
MTTDLINRLIYQLEVEYRRLTEKFKIIYGDQYPSVNDKEGWKLCGQIEGVSHAWKIAKNIKEAQK